MGNPAASGRSEQTGHMIMVSDQLTELSGQLLQESAGDDRKGNVLLIYHASLIPPDNPCLSRDEHSFGLAICVCQTMTDSEDEKNGVSRSLLECVSTALPFQDEVFQRVILYHVIEDGGEAELSEACRVLLRGGDLLLLGLNRHSWGGKRTYRDRSLPLIRLAPVQAALEGHDMLISRKLGQGLLGQDRPWMDRQRLSGLAWPFADVVLIQARHRSRPHATRLRLKELPAGAMPAA